VTSSVEVSKKVLYRDGISLLICEFILILLLGGDTLTWVHGLVLMLLYALYSLYMLSTMKSVNSEDKTVDLDEDEEESEDNDNKSIFFSLITLDLEPVFIKDIINSKNGWRLLIFSMLIIGAACLLLVKSCEWLGDELNIPIYFIAVILASAATSVPDTILSMKDAKKGNYDDAVSNALGSNIFDVCFALGFPLFLFTIIYGPIQMSPETVLNISELRILLFILTSIAFIIYIVKQKMGIISAMLLLLIYLLFTIYILGRSMDSEISIYISEWLRTINDNIDEFRFWKE